MSATFDDLEDAYERLAAGIDAAGAANEALFLAKLAMLLAEKLGDRQAFAASVDAALADLHSATDEADARLPQ
jgi:hypothetical protein